MLSLPYCNIYDYRYIKLKERDIEAMNRGGEISKFGREIIGRIFRTVKGMAPKIVNHVRRPQDNIDNNKSNENKGGLSGLKGKLNLGKVGMKSGIGNSNTAAAAANNNRKSIQIQEQTDYDILLQENSKVFLFWDMNRLLNQTKSNGTIEDSLEYKKFILDLELLLDKKGNLTQNGLNAYYELFGRLLEDVKGLGIGSLNDILVGKLNFSLQYDSDAVAALLFYMDAHTLYQPFLKSIITGKYVF